tara:strand:+ start:5475 stop:6098 length:624 start_codon:yes stop_codon:yes gene_type:complete
MNKSSLTIIEDYAFIKQTDIDIKKLHKLCLNINDFLESFLDEQEDNYVDNSFLAPLSTRCYNQYNLLCFIESPLHSVFTNIRDMFEEIVKENFQKKEYFVQCWLNVFSEKSPGLGWHSHFENESDAFHGFLVVNSSGESYTEYKKPDNKTFKIPSKEGLLVMTRSFQDLHRTSPIKKGGNRVTIAFDIVNSKSLKDYSYKSSHWIPI